MRSRLPGLLAAVLAAAMPLSACSSPGNGDQGVPASSGTGADTVSSGSSLDARYSQGAYGAWSVELPGDPHDTEAYGSVRAGCRGVLTLTGTRAPRSGSVTPGTWPS